MIKAIIFILFFSIFLISCDKKDASTSNICEPNPCAESPIAYKTVCEPIGDTDFTCICESGYELSVGTNLCVRPETDPCEDNPCSTNPITHKTICEAIADGFKCICEEDYHLDAESCVKTVNPCETNPCTEENKTKCIANSQTAGDYICECDSNYELIGDICKEIPLSEGCSMPIYKDIFDNDLKDLALINKLHIITGQNFISLGYDDAKYYLYNEVAIEDGDNQCVYTGRWHTAGGGAINCEHTWPQSQFNYEEPMKSDLHHLYTTESRVNSSRGHLRFANIIDHVDDYHDYDDYGQCNPDSEDYYCSKRLLSGGDNGIFEPADQHKGNVARAIFYFAIRYGNLSGPINGVTSPFINQDMKIAMKVWNKTDPVDDRERLRNDRIEGWLYIDGVREFSRLQGNRNPFIDCPELLDRIDLENIKFPEAYND